MTTYYLSLPSCVPLLVGTSLIVTAVRILAGDEIHFGPANGRRRWLTWLAALTLAGGIANVAIAAAVTVIRHREQTSAPLTK